jgi:hypothetical protein
MNEYYPSALLKTEIQSGSGLQRSNSDSEHRLTFESHRFFVEEYHASETDLRNLTVARAEKTLMQNTGLNTS